MLDIMRRKKRLKMILWVVILALALSMLVFFVPGVDIGNIRIDTSAASVDGQTIPMKDFIKAYLKIEKRYRDQSSSVDRDMLKAMGVPRQVLDTLIASKVKDVIAARLGVKVSPEEVRKAIEAFPVFQNQGNFIGIGAYRRILEDNDYTVADFEQEMYQTELTKKLRSIITDSLEVSDHELREEFSKETVKTKVDYVLLKKNEFEERIKPAEDQLRAYFDEHKDNYRIKEKRKIQYLLVPISQILPGIKVTEQDIQNEWDQSSHEETAEAAHILFLVPDPSKDAEVKARAEAVLKRAKAGENFAELAKKYSEDEGSASNGGVLPPFTREQMVKEFADVAFSLKKNEISDLVRTQYGYHIIKGLGVKIPTIEENRQSLITAIQLRKAKELAKQKAEEAYELAEKQKNFSEVAKNLGIAVEIKETKLFSKDESPFELGISQALRDEAFNLKDINSIGKAMEHPLGYAVPKLLEVQLPKPGDFNVSRDQVKKDYIDSKAKEFTQAEAKKLSDEALKQGSLMKAARAMGFKVRTSEEFTISEAPDSEIGTNPSFNKAAFELEPGGISAPLHLMDNAAVLEVKSRSPFDEAAFQKEKPALQKKLLQSMQDPYFKDFIQNVTEQLGKEGKIRINPKALEQL